MKTTDIINIPCPSHELVAFIEKAQQHKRECMKEMREKFLKTL